MSEVKVYGVAKSALWDSIGNPACFSNETMVVLKSDFDAQRLRADTAEAELQALRLVFENAEDCELNDAELKLAAAEQRIAELFSVLQMVKENAGAMEEHEWERIDAALNPNPEAESHE